MASPQKSPKLRCQKYYRRGKRVSEQDRAFIERNGKRVYLGKRGQADTLATYHRICADLAVLPDHPIVAVPIGGEEPLPLTITELCLQYLDYAEGYYRRPDGGLTTESYNIKVAQRPLREIYAQTPAQDFGPLALQHVRERMIELDWSRKNINSHVDRIRRMFKWGASQELIPASICEALHTVRGLRRGRTSARETSPVKPVPDALVDPVESHVSRQVSLQPLKMGLRFF